MNKKVRIYVAAHKVAPVFGDGSYQLIHVGAATSKISIPESIRDDDFDGNISAKNGIYCELTGLYYAWKNAEPYDILGLCHYRRYLGHHAYSLHYAKDILTAQEIIDDLQHYDIILPNKAKKLGQINGYFKNEDNLAKYIPYQRIKKACQELSPEYLEDIKQEFLTEYGCFGNIMIAPKKVFTEYCTWMFAILFKIEQNIIASGATVEPRELGYYSEWLLNVYVKHNHLKAKHYPVCFLDKQRYFYVKYILERLRISK